MDSYQAQQQYMRPPRPQPPSAADPYYYQQLQQQPSPQWYSNQWGQPPPPQWAPPPPPPPHADHLPPQGSYPPPPHPYPNNFPPPPPPPPQSRPHVASHLPPPPPLPPPPHSYPPHNQGAAPNWPNHQGWNYPAHNNQEDWEAKARAWADSRAAMENQHQQLQFLPPGRREDQTHYHDQYPQNGAQQVPVSGTSTHYPPGNHPQETSPVGSELSSYPHYAVRDGAPAGDPNVAFHRQGNLSTSPSVHQQEVPSSYSSVTGNENADGQHRMQPSQPLPFTYGNQSADPTTNIADQPLEFAPRFSSDHGPHMQSSYAYHDSLGNISVDPATIVPSMNAWTTSAASGVGYPPSLSVPSGPQQDPSMAYSPVPGHPPTSFGSFPGMSLQPTIPIAGAPFAHTAGTAVHPSVAFPADAYGVSTVSDRPRKAAVPNWLREEIKKAVITSAPMDHPKEETQYTEDEGVDRSLGKGDQADSKSINSSRSNEEEDDEDQVEAPKTSAINQQIKRILTEVLSKVTDELFDEIATKVLTEDDVTVEVDQRTLTTNNTVLPSPPEFSAPKASAKVLIPGKAKESETADVNSKSSSTLLVGLLGLANYATDDDDDDDDYDGPDGFIQNSGMPNSGKDVILQRSSVRNPSKDRHDATANDSSSVQLEAHTAMDLGETVSHESKYDNGSAISDISYSRHKNDASSAEKNLSESSSSELKDVVGTLKPELPKENATVKKTSKDDLQGRESRMRPDTQDQHESKKSSKKDFDKEVESGRIRADEKGDGKRRGQDERHSRNERTDDRNGSQEKLKEYGEKAHESESRKRSTHGDVTEDRTETDKLRGASAKEDANRKREHTKDKEDDRSRHRNTSDTSRHKRRRSPSVGSRGRNGKEDSVNHSNDSRDESSEDSKRKVHSRRRNSSPSPIRSRKRQVSRSPHIKHSQRRHSPYSSLDTNRGRRSRSRSPARRKK